MSNYVKKAVQKLLIQKRHRLYEERIAEQAVPYGVWMEKLLEEEAAEILRWTEERDSTGGARLSTAVLSWQAFCGCVLEDGEDDKRQEDLWIVTPDASCLAAQAAAQAERYFLEHPACDIAYGDEEGYLKPGWSPDLLQSFFYFGNVFVVRRTLAERVGRKMRDGGKCGDEKSGKDAGMCGEKESGKDAGKCGEKESGKDVGMCGDAGKGAPADESGDGTDRKDMLRWKKQLYEIVLHCVDEAGQAEHIERILFLSKKIGEVQEEQESLGRRAVQAENAGAEKHAFWESSAEDWGMEPAFDGVKKGHLYSDAEISEKKEEQELVSVIIPSKDNPAVLSHCIHSLREQTDYKNIEIIVIDNGSGEKNKSRIRQIRDQLREEYSFRYIYRPMAFNFSAMCNLGAEEAAGKYLLFLNDDMEIVREDWLRLMVSKAAKEYIGAVGAKLLYPDSDKIQHLGITNIHLGPAHKLQFSSDKKEYYHGFNRHAVNVSAVTGACLMVRREVFERTGGFDERLEVAFNDVEFCFRLLRAGYQNVCCNQTFLYHHESLSRGFDAGEEKVARLHRERDLLYSLYPEMWNRDACYPGRFVTDILDRGFVPACRFEEKRMSKRAEVLRMDEEPDPAWYNECLYMGLEFTGDECAWRTGKSGGGDYYIQGWSYAVTVDNSRYRKNLLLKPAGQGAEQDGQDNRQGSGMWRIPYEECYRPDFEENLPYIDHPALCGVSVWIGRDALPAGEYLIGYLWEDACSRQKLCGFSAERITIRAV